MPGRATEFHYISDLTYSFPNLTECFYPSLTYNRLQEALKVLDELFTKRENLDSPFDYDINEVRNAMTILFNSRPQPQSNHPFTWCEECHTMIGTDSHEHCQSCGGPSEELEECDNCHDCCDHSSCESCGNHIMGNMRYCDSCNCCDSCCNCDQCGECDHEATCQNCNNCGRHCNCGAHLDYVDYGEAWKADKRNLKLFNCDRLIGVEWEINNTSDSRYLEKWSRKWRGGIHEDGSCGDELVTPPLSGDYVIQCLSELGKSLKDSRATADSRCGIHVHVDVSDFQWADMQRLLTVYSKVEPLLYLLAGQQRINNTYCLPCGVAYGQALKSKDPKGKIMSVAYGVSDSRKYQRNKPQKKDQGRYRGLNIIPWLTGRTSKTNYKLWMYLSDVESRALGYPKYQMPKWITDNLRNFHWSHYDECLSDEKKHCGVFWGNSSLNKMEKMQKLRNFIKFEKERQDCTVEFRMHRNTLDPERIIGWTKVCARLVDWAAKADDLSVEKLPPSPLRALCQIIAPDCAPWILQRLKAWREATKFSGNYRRRIHISPGSQYNYDTTFNPTTQLEDVFVSRDEDYEEEDEEEDYDPGF